LKTCLTDRRKDINEESSLTTEPKNPLKQGPTEFEIMQAISASPGIKTKELRERLILGQRGKNSTALFRNRNSLVDRNLLKLGGDYSHHVTGEGETWLTTHSPTTDTNPPKEVVPA
jgi:hypothetical protein